jgi:hypothetical protein
MGTPRRVAAAAPGALRTRAPPRDSLSGPHAEIAACSKQRAGTPTHPALHVAPAAGMRRPCAATPGSVRGRPRVGGLLRPRKLASGAPPRRLAGIARSTADEQQREQTKAELGLPFESDLPAGPKTEGAPPPLRPGEPSGVCALRQTFCALRSASLGRKCEGFQQPTLPWPICAAPSEPRTRTPRLQRRWPPAPCWRASTQWRASWVRAPMPSPIVQRSTRPAST